METKEEIYKYIQIEVLQRYQTRYYREGETPKALGWGCLEDQLERFGNICKYNNLEGKRILDLGCGFSDFYGYMKQQGITCQYTGVDIIPEFIENCKKKYPEAEFLDGNILLDYDKIPSADYVISTGTLNFKLKQMDNLIYTQSFMEKAFSKADKKLILDFISTQRNSEYPEEEFIYYHSPMKVMEMAFKLTQDIELIHNYRAIPQKEFMIILSKKE